MGKMRRYDPDEEYHQLEYPQQQWSKTNKMKKSVKITYISSPLLMRTCHASEFRSVVQQLTGKDSNNDDFIIRDNNNDNHPHKNKNKNVQEASWMMMQLQGEGGATMMSSSSSEFDADGGNRGSSLSCYNRGVELEEDCFWKQVATGRSVLQSSPCVVLV